MWTKDFDRKVTSEEFIKAEKPLELEVILRIKSMVDGIVKRHKLKKLQLDSCTLTPCGQQEQIKLDFLQGAIV